MFLYGRVGKYVIYKTCTSKHMNYLFDLTPETSAKSILDVDVGDIEPELLRDWVSWVGARPRLIQDNHHHDI